MKKFLASYTLPIKQAPVQHYIPVGWVGVGRTFEADYPSDAGPDPWDARPCWVQLSSGGYVCIVTEQGTHRAKEITEK